MRIVVTGGSGRRVDRARLCRARPRGHQPGRSRQAEPLPGSFIKLDLTDAARSATQQTQPDAVCHLAANPSPSGFPRQQTFANTFYAGVYNMPTASRKSRLQEMVTMAGLTGRERQLAGQLSGGWKQRLALGCAFIHRPQLLVLDEPTAGVDPVSRQDFWRLIHDLTREGVTIFVTTHYLDEAEYANRIGMINDGILRAVAAPSELKRALHGQLINVVCDAPFDAVNVLDKLPGVLNVALQGNNVHARIKNADISAEQVADAVRAAGITVHEVQPLEPTLEDVFISLIE
ncbi:MAG: DUF4162 domain-containing protein [Caldilineaceae bacterium]